MKGHHQSSILAYAKKGHLETEQSDEPSSDSDLDGYLDDLLTSLSTELETSSAAVESSEAHSKLVC